MIKQLTESRKHLREKLFPKSVLVVYEINYLHNVVDETHYSHKYIIILYIVVDENDYSHSKCVRKWLFPHWWLYCRCILNFQSYIL